jgi:outer membrane receptor protein involved in Fe transport
VFYSSLNVGCSLERAKWGQAAIYMNIQNLFDRQPPLAGNTGGGFTHAGSGSPVTGDDLLGRNFTPGLRYRL